MSDPVMLAPKLDLPAASDLVISLRAHDDEEDIVIDMSDVTHLGALCMQVLLSTARTAQAEQRSMTIINTSDRVLDQMRVMGMTPETIARGGI